MGKLRHMLDSRLDHRRGTWAGALLGAQPMRTQTRVWFLGKLPLPGSPWKMAKEPYPQERGWLGQKWGTIRLLVLS